MKIIWRGTVPMMIRKNVPRIEMTIKNNDAFEVTEEVGTVLLRNPDFVKVEEKKKR